MDKHLPFAYHLLYRHPTCNVHFHHSSHPWFNNRTGSCIVHRHASISSPIFISTHPRHSHPGSFIDGHDRLLYLDKPPSHSNYLCSSRYHILWHSFMDVEWMDLYTVREETSLCLSNRHSIALPHSTLALPPHVDLTHCRHLFTTARPQAYRNSIVSFRTSHSFCVFKSLLARAHILFYL